MSSFRDQFSKDEKKSSVLDYDNSAAKYFMGSIGSIFLIFWSYYVLSNLCALTLCRKPPPPPESSQGKKRKKE